MICIRTQNNMAMHGISRALNVLILMQIWSTPVVAQFGMGFGGGMRMGMGMGMGMGMDLSRYFGSNSMLGRAVRDIVHQNARPSQAMIDIAVRNRGPPATIAEMQEYTPHMTLLAFQHGVKPNGTQSPSLDQMNNYIVERGINWMRRRGLISDPVPAAVSANANATQNAQSATSSSSSGSVSTGSSYSTSNGSTGSSQTPVVVGMVGISGNVASTGNVVQPQVSSATLPPATQAPFGYDVSTSPNALFNDFMIMDMAGLDLGIF